MRYIKILLLLSFIIVESQSLWAQGCVAIRGSSCSAGLGVSNTLLKGEFIAGTGFRYFKSFRHFRGLEEETNRIAEGTEVVNKSYFVDLSLNYGITDRLFANVIVPFVHHNRSSMYEHGGNPPNGLGERHETSAKGLADVRLGLGYWLFDPNENQSFNYAFGLGLKLPTGKYDYKDTFYNQGSNKDESIESVVDQSIQPGDGGTGIAIDLQGYQTLSNTLVLSTNLYYLLNFQATNGVLTRNGSSEFSCPDQFAARIGAFYNTSISGFSGYLGARVEGVPSKDLVGKSYGYRRPGYAISVEPGIGYNTHKYAINLSVPIALIRNRTQSYEDKQRTIDRGVYTHGDAAFADYLWNVNFSYRFGGKHTMKQDHIPIWEDIKNGTR
ncbi:MAG: transporter [Saprospiraceae bacterium]